MTREFKVFTGMLILWAFSYGLFFQAIPAIDNWERVNHYPLGLHCELWNTCN
jgi:hypothetical protein